MNSLRKSQIRSTVGNWVEDAIQRDHCPVMMICLSDRLNEGSIQRVEGYSDKKIKAFLIELLNSLDA